MERLFIQAFACKTARPANQSKPIAKTLKPNGKTSDAKASMSASRMNDAFNENGIERVGGDGDVKM
jgi:hypothetical protein